MKINQLTLLAGLVLALTSCFQASSPRQPQQAATVVENDSFNYRRFIKIAALGKMDSVDCYVFDAQSNYGHGVLKGNTIFSIRAWAETENWGKTCYLFTRLLSTDPIFRSSSLSKEKAVSRLLKHVSEVALPFLKEPEILASIQEAVAAHNYSFDPGLTRLQLVAGGTHVESVEITVETVGYSGLVVEVLAKSTLPIPD